MVAPNYIRNSQTCSDWPKKKNSPKRKPKTRLQNFIVMIECAIMFFWSYRKKTIIILLKPFFIGPQSTIVYTYIDIWSCRAKPIWTSRPKKPNNQSPSYPPMLFLHYQNIVSAAVGCECQTTCTLVPMYKENGSLLVYVVLLWNPLLESKSRDFFWLAHSPLTPSSPPTIFAASYKKCSWPNSSERHVYEGKKVHEGG